MGDQEQTPHLQLKYQMVPTFEIYNLVSLKLYKRANNRKGGQHMDKFLRSSIMQNSNR